MVASTRGARGGGRHRGGVHHPALPVLPTSMAAHPLAWHPGRTPGFIFHRRFGPPVDIAPLLAFGSNESRGKQGCCGGVTDGRGPGTHGNASSDGEPRRRHHGQSDRPYPSEPALVEPD